MKQCATHHDQPPVFYCTEDHNYYCGKCISKHSKHQGVMGIEERNVQTQDEEQTRARRAEAQSRYTALSAAAHGLAQLQSRTNTMLNAAIYTVRSQIKECKASTTGKLLKSTTKESVVVAKYMELYDSLKKRVKELVYSGLKTKIESLSSTSLPGKIHWWEGNTITICNNKAQKINKITLDKKINGYADSISVGDKIFIMGGSGPINAIYEVELKKQLLVEKQPMKCKKYWHTLCYLCPFVYTIGGYDGSYSLNDTEKYNINTNQWEALPLLNTPRRQCAAFIWDNCVFAFCGNNRFDSTDNYINSMEKLRLCNCNKWNAVTVDNPPSCRESMHGISINDGVIVFGGDDGKWRYSYDIGMNAICLRKRMTNGSVAY